MASARDQSAGVRAATEIARLNAGRHQTTRDLAARLDDLVQMIRAHEGLKGKGQGGSRKLYALNRAAVIMLTGHFQSFITDLFSEVWASQYPGSSPDRLVSGFGNPWPDEVDSLFGLLGFDKVTRIVEPRKAMTSRSRQVLSRLTEPDQVRAGRAKYQARSVVGELVAMRNRSSHGAQLRLRLRDVTNYLIDVVRLALALDGAV